MRNKGEALWGGGGGVAANNQGRRLLIISNIATKGVGGNYLRGRLIERRVLFEEIRYV